MQTKTKVEIDNLVKEWTEDPCWDLGDTEGFEVHKEELLKIQQEYEARWKNELRDRDRAEAEKLNISVGNLKEYEKLKDKADSDRIYGKRLLNHYFGILLGDGYNSDSQAEIDMLADSLIDSAIAEVKADLILKNNQLGK